MERRRREPPGLLGLTKVQHEPGAEGLTTKETEERSEDERVVVKQGKHAEDQSGAECTQDCGEDRQQDEREPSLHKEPRCSRQDREEMTHPVAPGLQVR